MKRRTALLAIAVAALTIARALPVSATDLRNVLADYSITSWGTKDGLPIGTIKALAQDADGYLWLGADFGLVRFDGVHFVPWSVIGHTPLPQAPVQSLHVSQDGSLWVGFGGDGGISRITGNRATNYGTSGGLSTGGIDAIVEDRGGAIIAVSGGALWRFSIDRWTKWEPRESPERDVRTAYLGRSGDLFLVTREGIFVRRQGQKQFQPLERRPEVLTPSVAEDGSGRLWITQPVLGFRAVNDDRGHPPAENGKGYRLLTDRAGNLWVATLGQGLWRVHAGGPTPSLVVERATELTGLSNNTASALLEDREGNIWAGTSDGLNRLTARKFAQIPDLGFVTGLEATSDGSAWASSPNGLVQLAPVGNAFKPVRRFMKGVSVRAMYADNDGTLWVATNNDLRRSVQGPGPRTLSIVTSERKRIRAITSDMHGGVWIYDNGRGLAHWNQGRLEPFALPRELADVVVMTAYSDRIGRIWLGFANGMVAAIDPDGTIRSYAERDGLDAGISIAIYGDETGTIWVVGRNGLARFSGGRFATLHEGRGFPAHLTGLIQEDGGDLWFGSGAGIVRMNRSEFDRAVNGRWEDVNFKVYDSSDGIVGTTYFLGQRNAIRTKDGRLWFLTSQGVTIVDPRALQTTYAPARVRIDSATADGTKLDPTAQLQLSAGTSRLDITYTVPDLTSTLKTRFRYRLEGFDTDWIDAGSQRQAIYTRLPPRTYLFRVQANNQDGAWARPSATWAFSIAPRFYQRPMFYAFVVAFMIAALWAGWQVRLTQLRRRFALLLGERVRLSREIHDTLLQSLVGVTLQLDHIGKDLESTPSETREQFLRLRRQVEDYIREARQSIWNLRSSTLQRYDLATALRQTGERASDTDVSFDLQVIGEPRRYASATEEQVLRIGQEAITNALRHSHAHQISMELHYEEASLRLRVSDDGQGFELGRVDGTGHTGVVSMKERAESVGGALRISSRPGAGTLIETIVPAQPST